VRNVFYVVYKGTVRRSVLSWLWTGLVEMSVVVLRPHFARRSSSLPCG